MPITSRPVRPVLAGILVCLCSLLMLCPIAAAAPITVNLRVEGSTATLFEGPISTDAIEAPPGIEGHPCDVKDNGANGGFGTASATPTAALYDAATANGLAFGAEWSSKYDDFLVTQVGTDVNGGEPEYPSWGYAVNYTTAGVGGCQFQLAPGSEVLWAYNYFNLKHLLSLSGPASVDVGTPFTVHVVDGQTGQPLSGAAIGEVTAGVTTTIPSSPATDANGDATITLAHAGTVTLKATQAESVRSNGLTVCVHNGNDGTCGTTETPIACPAATSTCGEGPVHVLPYPQPPRPDVARVTGVVNGHVYSHRSAPRILKGSVEVPAGGTLREVRVRLQRRYRGRCSYFSGRTESFVRARCSRAPFFSVGTTTSFTYLLPARLPAGRYVYEIQAVDDHGDLTKLTGGVSRVVFSVK